jgi:Domain of unknown function (DUF4115)
MQDALGALDGALRTGREPDAAGPVELHSVQKPPLLSHAETLEDWVQAAVTAVGGAVRQQEEEIHELMDRVERAGIETKSWPAQIQALQSQMDILNAQVQIVLARLDSAIGDHAHSANEPSTRPERGEDTVEPDSAPLRKPESRAEEPSRRTTYDQGVLKEPEPAVGILSEPPVAGEPFREPASRRGSVWRRLTWVVLAAAIPVAGWFAYTQRGLIDAFRDPDPPPAFKLDISVPELTEPPKLGEEAASPPASQSVSVVVTAKEEIWLEAETDSDRVFSRMLPANQKKSFDASRQIKILTGNMRGTYVSYNGTPIGPLGSSHRVGAFLFTLQGWKRVAR